MDNDLLEVDWHFVNRKCSKYMQKLNSVGYSPNIIFSNSNFKLSSNQTYCRKIKNATEMN